MTIKDELYRIRLRLNETQAIFAKRFGVHQSTYQRWETHGVPKYGAAKYAVEAVLEDLKPKRVSQNSGGKLVEQQQTASVSPVREWKF